eukprot:239306_1
MKRKFFSIDVNAVDHIKQLKLCSGMTNISKYYQFEIISPNIVRRRFLDCKCNNCVNFDWNNCSMSDICGKWSNYNIKTTTTNAIWIRNSDIIIEDDKFVSDSSDNASDFNEYEYESNSDNANNDEEYCFSDCSMPEDDDMVQCDKCDEWYHYECVGLTSHQARTIPKWYCDRVHE